jgi:hypothetical protein
MFMTLKIIDATENMKKRQRFFSNYALSNRKNYSRTQTYATVRLAWHWFKLISRCKIQYLPHLAEGCRTRLNIDD